MDGNKLNGQVVTEKALLENGYRKYSGEDIDIFYNKDVCIYSGNCVRGNADVFNLSRKPWIEPANASAEEEIQVINTCPSGALKFIQHEEK